VIGPLDPADPHLHPLLIAAYGVESELIGADVPAALNRSPERSRFDAR
jgi:hypothetical protein